MKIKNKIKFYREEKKLTQKELAQKSTISERQLIRIETGAQDPKISTVIKIALSLEKEIGDLFPISGATEQDKPSRK